MFNGLFAYLKFIQLQPLAHREKIQPLINLAINLILFRPRTLTGFALCILYLSGAQTQDGKRIVNGVPLTLFV